MKQTNKSLWLPSVVFATFALSTLFNITADAQRKSPARRAKPSATKVAAKRIKNPIERLSEELIYNGIVALDADLATACRVANFKGLLFALDGGVSDWNYGKGEFETTADYSARMAKMEKGINGDRKTIVCKPLKDDTAFIKYDADKEEFKVDSYLLTHNSTDEKDTGSYTSSTRMGVKAKVYQSVRFDYEVDFGSDTYNVAGRFGCSAQSYGPIHFPVASAMAQDVKAQGFVVMIGHLRQPFYSKTERSGKPTLDDPFDTYVTTLSLKFEPENIFLVSGSGERVACLK